MDNYSSSSTKVIAHGFRRREINGEIVFEALPKPTQEVIEQIQAEAGRELAFDYGCYVMASGGSLSCYNDGGCADCILHETGSDAYCGCVI